jgi:hypothetical protein
MDPDEFLWHRYAHHRRRQRAQVAVLLIWIALCATTLFALVWFWSRA